MLKDNSKGGGPHPANPIYANVITPGEALGAVNDFVLESVRQIVFSHTSVTVEFAGIYWK